MLITNSNLNSSFTVSMLNKTNRLVSNSQDNFGGLRPGSFIKLGTENILYQISKVQQFYLLKDFKVINNREILIESNTEINLQQEDIIKIIFDEYKLDSIIGISQAGKFYKENEEIKVKGGELSIDISDGIGSPTKLKIEELDSSAGIKKISLIDAGKYVSPPQGQCEILGNGQDAKLDLKYSVIENRSIIERTIKNIQLSENETKITLDYSLPLGIKGGKISVEKWEMFLSNDYLGPSLQKQNYQIFKDFTPNLNLPLMLQNSSSMDLIFNQAMNKIDTELQALKDKL